MSSFPAGVKSRVHPNCRAERCRKGGCSVDVSDLPSRLVVDMDCRELGIPDGQKRCDYVVFTHYETVKWVVPVEMKEGRLDESVHKQIQGGADFANYRLVPADQKVELQPLAVIGKDKKRTARINLRRRTIKFRGKKYAIKVCRPGESLKKVFDQRLKQSPR